MDSGKVLTSSDPNCSYSVPLIPQAVDLSKHRKRGSDSSFHDDDRLDALSSRERSTSSIEGPSCHVGRTCAGTEALLRERDQMISGLQKVLLQKSQEIQSLKRKLHAYSTSSQPPLLPMEGRVRTSSGTFERVHIRLPNDEGAKHFTVRVGEYLDVKHMGRDGTFGSLVSAIRRSDNRVVVIKRQTIADIGNCETSLRELACLTFLTLRYPHPNIISMLDCWVADNHLYIVEEKHPGTLRDMVRKGPAAMAPSRRFSIIAGLLSGLRHMHGCGILHRDLKPSNIVIDPTGMHPRIIDLGSGRRTGAVMTTGQHVTTYPYRAPEEVQAQTRYKSKVDLWSAGCILAEMITCKRLFPCQEPEMPKAHAAHLSQMRHSHIDDRWTEQKAAGGLQMELEALDGLVEHNAERRWDAATGLSHLGQGEYHLRPVGPYVEKVYDVHDLRGMHRIIHDEVEHFARVMAAKLHERER